MTNNDTEIMENLTGIISMETNHIIDGIPDVPHALRPRYPMNGPVL